ncbi:MAG: hypothetical protein K8S55_12725 [Phycisphaerae bacterium]|nr:hypothetical protein [Phycisphaerae bacterium]
MPGRRGCYRFHKLPRRDGGRRERISSAFRKLARIRQAKAGGYADSADVYPHNGGILISGGSREEFRNSRQILE